MARPDLPQYNDLGGSLDNPDSGWVKKLRLAIFDISDRVDAAAASIASLAASVASKAADSAVVKLMGDQTVDGIKTFLKPPVVPTPTAANHAANRAFVEAQVAAGGGSGGGPTSNSVGARISVADYGSLVPWTSTMTPAQVINMLATNDGTFDAAWTANPNSALEGPDWFVPTTINWTKRSVNLKAKLMHIAAARDGSNNVTIPAKSAFTITNPNGPYKSVTVNYGVAVGTNSASSGMVAELIDTLTLPTTPGAAGRTQGGYADFRTGDVYQIASKNKFDWADQAINNLTSEASVWRSEYVTIRGITMNVTAVNFSGLTDLNTPNTIERRKVRNSTGTLIGIVNGWSFNSGSTTAGKIDFPFLTADFVSGEALYDVDTGSQIGVAGSMSLSLFNRLEWYYSTDIRIFKVDKSLKVKLDLNIISNLDPELINKDAAPTVTVSAPWQPEIRLKVTDVQSRAIIIKAAYMGSLHLDEVWGISNHALNLSNPYAENRYGYGGELRGPTYMLKVTGSGGNLRHLVTSNPNGRTWESSTDAHLDYGCGAMFPQFNNMTADSCYSAGFDLHSGAYMAHFNNCKDTRPSGWGHWLTTSYGFQDRGIGTTYTNCVSIGAVIGFVEGGAGLLAGVKHQPTFENCKALDYQQRGWVVNAFLDANGVAQDGTTQLGVYAKVVLNNCLARGDGITGSQAGFEFGAGVYDLNIKSERFSLMPWWIKAGSTVTGGGRHVWREMYADWSEGTGTNPARIDTQLDLLRIHGTFRYMARGTSTTPVPAYLLRAVGGSTIVQHEGFSGASTVDAATGLATARPQNLELQSGSTATLVDTR